ncbi:MAG: DUF2974 domain-containing protein [Oscillospiraceae bacterium]|nr:DUF2974 domain-containing protein [Oscillospiraceae bacterium]
MPTDYHSDYHSSEDIGDVSGFSIDSLDAYYQGYTHQDGRPYTIRQDLLLSRLAYIKAPPGFRGEIEGVTVRELCREIERALENPDADASGLFGRNRQELLDIVSGIGEDSQIGALIVRGYIDDASGLAGYVLENNGELTIALRGTDDGVDMLDNAILLPFNLSVQYASVRRLLAAYGGARRIWLTGHSKGGHNAIYAASIDPRCRATGFNAPGFGVFLSDAQHDGLSNGVNYVVNGDVTGFLLFHLERRAVLESPSATPAESPSLRNRHKLDNFFSVDDLMVSSSIHPLGIWSEWITQIIWLSLVFLAGYGIIVLLKKVCCGVIFIFAKILDISKQKY